MSKNIWFPLVAAVACQGASALMSLTIPETLPSAVFELNGRLPLLRDTISSETHDEPLPKKSWRNRLKQTKDSFAFVSQDATVATLVCTFLISKVGRQTLNVVLQYVSKRYGWNLATVSTWQSSFGVLSTTDNCKAGLLLSLRAVVNIALFTVILPLITAFALPRMSAVGKDLFIAKASVVFMTLGTLIMFLGATSALMILGKWRNNSEGP
jgi:hypothetical protein